MYARAVTIQAQPARLEEVLCFLEKCTLSAGEQHPELEGVLLLADKKAGKALSITLWRTKEAMRPFDTDYLAELAGDLETFLDEPPVTDNYVVRLRTEAVRAQGILQFSETSLGIRTENPCDEKLRVSSDYA